MPAVAVLIVMTLSADVIALTELQRRADSPIAAQWRTRPRLTPGDRVQAPELHQVAPFQGARQPHLFVVAAGSLPAGAIERIRRHEGVTAVEVVDAAEVRMSGKQVTTMGVDPSTFRAYTPKPTASSDALWHGVAAGEVAVSFGLGTDGGMKLGTRVRSGDREMRIGALATVGMGSIDAVVSRQTGRLLGIPQGNALIVSAPRVDSAKLRDALLRDLPRGVQVVIVNPAMPKTARAPGSVLPAGQVRVVLTAAASKLGAPYVWGAEGPDAFDCSGLIQWAFAQAGVRLPRVTHQQFASGVQVPFSHMQPGDLLFWRLDPTNPAYVSHAAIYWGDGKMIQAPRTGEVVRLAPVHTRNLAGVVRITLLGNDVVRP